MKIDKKMNECKHKHVIKIDNTTTPTQDLSAAVIAIFDEQRSSTIQTALKARVERGYSVYRPPIGYDKTRVPGLYIKNEIGNLISFHVRQAINKKITIQELQEIMSYLCKSKHTISLKRLRSIATNPFYAGLISHKGSLYKGLHEPILSKNEHEKIKDIFS